MFSTCSKHTPRAPIPDGRMERIMQPCLRVRSRQAAIAEVIDAILHILHNSRPRLWHIIFRILLSSPFQKYITSQESLVFPLFVSVFVFVTWTEPAPPSSSTITPFSRGAPTLEACPHRSLQVRNFGGPALRKARGYVRGPGENHVCLGQMRRPSGLSIGGTWGQWRSRELEDPDIVFPTV